MKELLLRALDTARLRGASYADARFVDEERQVVLVKDGRVEAVTSDTSRGIGVRVIANGGWGFAASSRLGAPDVDMAAAIIAAFPTLLVYVVAGKYFIRGLTAGSVKG